MQCEQAEKALLKSLDHPLEKGVKQELERHLASCPGCRAMREDYQLIFTTLKEEPVPEMKPFFWQRLKPRLEQRIRPRTQFLWKGLGPKAVSFAFLILLLVFTAVALLTPDRTSSLAREELSQTEVFLWRESNPFQETRSVFEQEDAEGKNISLIFADLDDQISNRRDFP